MEAKNVKVIEKDKDFTFSDVVTEKELELLNKALEETVSSKNDEFYKSIGYDDDEIIAMKTIDEDYQARHLFHEKLRCLALNAVAATEGAPTGIKFKENPLGYDEEHKCLIPLPTPDGVVTQQVFRLDKTPTITKKYLTKNKYSRPGTKRSKTTKIAWHYTGGAKVPAINTWRYFEGLKEGVKVNGRYVYASSQYIVGLNGEIYQLMPDTEIAYTTNQANAYSIGIECSHINNDGEYTEIEYRSMVWLGVVLAKKYGLNPKTDFIRHYDVTEKWCPMWFVKHPSAWKQFKQDCYDVLHGKDLDIVVGNYEEIKNRKDYNFQTTCEVVNVKTVLNVRASRPVDGTLGEKLFDIPLGDTLKLGYVLNNWAYIDYKGKNGFVNIKYLKIVK